MSGKPARRVGEKAAWEEFQFAIVNDDGREVSAGGEGAFRFGEFSHALLVLERVGYEFPELRFTVVGFRRTVLAYGPTKGEKEQGIAEWSISTPWVTVDLAGRVELKAIEDRDRLRRLCARDDGAPSGLERVLRAWDEDRRKR